MVNICVSPRFLKPNSPLQPGEFHIFIPDWFEIWPEAGLLTDAWPQSQPHAFPNDLAGHFVLWCQSWHCHFDFDLLPAPAMFVAGHVLPHTCTIPATKHRVAHSAVDRNFFAMRLALKDDQPVQSAQILFSHELFFDSPRGTGLCRGLGIFQGLDLFQRLDIRGIALLFLHLLRLHLLHLHLCLLFHHLVGVHPASPLLLPQWLQISQLLNFCLDPLLDAFYGVLQTGRGQTMLFQQGLARLALTWPFAICLGGFALSTRSKLMNIMHVENILDLLTREHNFRPWWKDSYDNLSCIYPKFHAFHICSALMIEIACSNMW